MSTVFIAASTRSRTDGTCMYVYSASAGDEITFPDKYAYAEDEIAE